jgi:hypothetical protein
MGVAVGKFVGVNVGAGVGVAVGMVVGGGVLVGVLVGGIVGEATIAIVVASSGEGGVVALAIAAGMVAVIVGKSSITGAMAGSLGGSDRPTANHSRLSGNRYMMPTTAVANSKQVKATRTAPNGVKGNREDSSLMAAMANRRPQPPQKEAVPGFWWPQFAHGALLGGVILVSSIILIIYPLVNHAGTEGVLPGIHWQQRATLDARYLVTARTVTMPGWALRIRSRPWSSNCTLTISDCGWPFPGSSILL